MQKVKEIMSTDVQYCTPLDNVYEVAVKMRDLNVGAIPIVEEDKIIGMVTDRDIVIRGIAEKRSGSYKITNVMSDQIVQVSPDDTVKHAAQIMAKHQIRRLPVTENGRLVGIVSLGDLSVNNQSDEMAGDALNQISQHNLS